MSRFIGTSYQCDNVYYKKVIKIATSERNNEFLIKIEFNTRDPAIYSSFCLINFRLSENDQIPNAIDVSKMQNSGGFYWSGTGKKLGKHGADENTGRSRSVQIVFETSIKHLTFNGTSRSQLKSKAEC